jgi:S-adenosylmethionine:diacylglycerol 3-amino-3-carboxypropyl transferase
MEKAMNENVPFIWRKNYRNEAASPEKVLENAHEKARQHLRRAAKIHESNQIKR